MLPRRALGALLSGLMAAQSCPALAAAFKPAQAHPKGPEAKPPTLAASLPAGAPGSLDIGAPIASLSPDLSAAAGLAEPSRPAPATSAGTSPPARFRPPSAAPEFAVPPDAQSLKPPPSSPQTFLDHLSTPLSPADMPERIWTEARSRGFATGRELEEAPPQGSASPDDGARLKPPSPAAKIPRPLLVLLGSLALTNFGAEVLSLGAPQLAEKLTHDYTTVTAISAAAPLALSLGSLAAGPVIARIGTGRTYLASLLGRAAAIGAAAALLAGQTLSPWTLVGLFSVDQFLFGATMVAESAMAPLYLGDDLVKLNRYGVLRQIIVDSIGFVAPIAGASAILRCGYPAVLGAYPLLFILAAALATGTLLRAPAPTAEPGQMTVGQVARSLWSSPVLRTAALAYLIFNTASLSLYFMIGPAYGFFVSPLAHESATSLLTGFFAAGGLIGSYLVHRLNRAIERQSGLVPAGPSREAAKRKEMLVQMARWIGRASAGLLLFWSVFLTAPLFSARLPIRLTQLLMIPFGATEAVVLVGLLSLIQSEAPAQAKARTISLVRFGSLFVPFVFLIPVGIFFNALSLGSVPTRPAFLVLNAALTAAAGLGLWLSRALRRYAESGSAPWVKGPIPE